MGRTKKVLSAAQVRRLRSMLTCVVCGIAPGETGWVQHNPGCPVPGNVEGDGTKPGRPRVHSDPGPKVWDKKCLECGDPVPEPPADLSGSRGAMRKRSICSDQCRKARRRTYSRRHRAWKGSVS